MPEETGSTPVKVIDKTDVTIAVGSIVCAIISIAGSFILTNRLANKQAQIYFNDGSESFPQ